MPSLDSQLTEYAELAVPVAHLAPRSGKYVTLGLRAEEFALDPTPSDNKRVTAALPTGAVWYFRVCFGTEPVTV